jgi:hypothetical protein
MYARKTLKTRTCPHCQVDIKARGYASHERSCYNKQVKQREDEAFHSRQSAVAERIPPGETPIVILYFETLLDPSSIETITRSSGPSSKPGLLLAATSYQGVFSINTNR